MSDEQGQSFDMAMQDWLDQVGRCLALQGFTFIPKADVQSAAGWNGEIRIGLDDDNCEPDVVIGGDR